MICAVCRMAEEGVDKRAELERLRREVRKLEEELGVVRSCPYTLLPGIRSYKSLPPAHTNHCRRLGAGGTASGARPGEWRAWRRRPVQVRRKKAS